MIVAVIGHGPSVAGKGWGQAIDRCDRVVRIWECGWQPAADYGARYDVGIFTVWPNELARFRKHRAAQPSPERWWAYDLRNTTGGAYEEPGLGPARVMDPRPWNRLGLELGGRGTSGKFEMTRGGIAAAYAATWLRPLRLHLVGFDAIEGGRCTPLEHNPAFAAAYRATGVPDGPDFDVGARRTPTHDWQAERAVILEAARASGTEVLWSI